MDLQFVELLIKNTSFAALFIFFFVWFLKSYIPAKDADHAKQMADIQSTFRESLDKIVTSFEKSTDSIIGRLDVIETDISKLKKK